MAFHATNHLVVWSELVLGTGFDILGQFIDASGVKQGDPFPIVETGSVEVYPDVAFNGTYYLVVWFDASRMLGQLLGKGGPVGSQV